MLGILFLALRIILTISLFAFLGWALLLLWKDLNKAAQLSLGSIIPALKLTPSEGENPFQFTKAEVLIGRDPACQCHLSDKTISGKHARLFYDLSQWWVEDLGSTNGTFLNQQAVNSPMVLTSGDQLRVGRLSFEVFVTEIPAPTMDKEFL